MQHEYKNVSTEKLCMKTVFKDDMMLHYCEFTLVTVWHI